MLRRLALFLTLFAVAALPAIAANDFSYLDYSHPHFQQPGATDFSWVTPVFGVMSLLLSLLGVLPGIVARKKGMPNWKSKLFFGLLFGFLFFPGVLWMLYKISKYESPADQWTVNQADFRPMNDAFIREVPPPPQPKPAQDDVRVT